MKHLIIGNGAAGISGAEKLRQLDKDCEITIISMEDTPVYSKFMLPDYIGGKIKKERLILRNLKYYDENNIKLVLKANIENIDTDARVVTLSNGDKKEYDKLLLAIGGRPVVPNIEGLKDAQFFTVNSIDDADNIKENVVQGGQAVIVGAGLTGIEVAFALKRLGMKVCIIERETRILPMQLDEISAKMLVDQIISEGIQLLLGKNLKKVDKERKTLILEDGEFNYDMLVMSIGTRPNLDIVKNTEIKTERGILVNQYLESSVKDVFAAGDVAQTLNPMKGYVSSYIWPNALAQGKCAASNMVGENVEFSFDSCQNNAVRLRDLPFVSMGMINPTGATYDFMVFFHGKGGIYRKVVLEGDKIKGMIFLGDISSANLISDFIRNSVDVSKFKDILLDTDFVAKYKSMN